MLILITNARIEAEHIRLVEAVNNAKTQAEHDRADMHLHGWREGVRACGYQLDMCAADWRYMNADENNDRPMCCGVWLDWSPVVEVERKAS